MFPTASDFPPPAAPLLAPSPSRPERFERTDFIAGGLVFLITLGVYIATLAPSVTLLDSGELITAATRFGVGHPPGYPLWTLCGFLLTHLFPFGNLAWRMNLMCAIFGATANAVLTLLACHSGRWLLQRWTEPALQPAVRPFCFYSGLFVGVTLGFSNVMWSQAVISAVHGTLNALFINLVLLLFYLWMLEPHKAYRLTLAALVFGLGLTNHHTLVQIIPAFLIAAALMQLGPFVLRKPSDAPAGIFFSVFLSIILFSLSILIYISWLSRDPELQAICQVMARVILGVVAVVSFFYLKKFRLGLFLIGVFTAIAFFVYGHYLFRPSNEVPVRWSLQPHFWLWGSYIHPGWLQIETAQGVIMLILVAVALGLFFTSTLNRSMVIGVFAAGWIGLFPYAYEPFASATRPPMNWGYAAEPAGFYYEISREQYPKSLPALIKMTVGKAIGVVPKNAHLDSTIGLPNYYPRLWQTFGNYGANLRLNFTFPLLFLVLAIFLYIRRNDWPQINWIIFLVVAWFFVGFMLQLIAPLESFDFEHNLQNKVFHLQSHCIFVLLLGYGALAVMVCLRQNMAQISARTGPVVFGVPFLFLSLLPFWSNFDKCSQAGHWFGYDFGADIMRPMDKNAVYFGGTDAGRFVPTYMAFVESQQDDRWKREPGFDRRDVAVITQNALCDGLYDRYIREQYDPRYRLSPDQYTPFEKWLGREHAYPEIPVTCIDSQELDDCWKEYQERPDVVARVRTGGPLLRSGSNDVFGVNSIVAQKIFEKNKAGHTFYIEQSIPMPWMYPYLLPSGLIFKLNPDPLAALPASVIEDDRKFWDGYSARLLRDRKFRADDDAVLAFSKLAFWHADLYRWRHLEPEEEHWLKMALALCPQLSLAVDNLVQLMARQNRFDEAFAVIRQAQLDDPHSSFYSPLLDRLKEAVLLEKKEQALSDAVAKSPADLLLNLQLAKLLQDEGKYSEVNERLRIAAGLPDWTHQEVGDVMQYFVETVHNPDAAIEFLKARARIVPNPGEVIYSLAALHATLNHKDEAIKYLGQAIALDGANAINSAQMDARFASLQNDPRFEALLTSSPPPTR